MRGSYIDRAQVGTSLKSGQPLSSLLRTRSSRQSPPRGGANRATVVPSRPQRLPRPWRSLLLPVG